MAELRLSRAGRRVLKVSEDVLRLLSEEARRAVERLDLSGDQRLAALLNDLYWRAGLSSSDIARLLGVDGRGLRRMMERLGVARRPRLEALKAKLTRFAKKPFDGDPVKRVRLHCLVAAEGHARRHHGQVEVTTSTPNPWLIQAFHELFRPYTEHFNKLPFYNRKTGQYEWRISILLDESFTFLAEPLTLDVSDDEQFWEFMTSFFEGESSLKAWFTRSGLKVRVELINDDWGLVEPAWRGLLERGFEVDHSVSKPRERGGDVVVSHTLGLTDCHALRFLEEVAPRTRHYEKLLKAEALLRAARLAIQPWGVEAARSLVEEVGRLVDHCVWHSKQLAEAGVKQRSKAQARRRREGP